MLGRVGEMKRIKLFVLDVDGTLTDGGLYLDGHGSEFKRFDVRDGMGIALLRDAGVTTAFLSGSRSEATARRAEELAVERVLNGIREKLPAFLGLLADLELDAEETAYMGDDVNDVECLRAAGVSFAPADAAARAKEAAGNTTKRSGGHGAVREAAEYILAHNARCMNEGVPECLGGTEGRLLSGDDGVN